MKNIIEKLEEKNEELGQLLKNNEFEKAFKKMIEVQSGIKELVALFF